MPTRRPKPKLPKDPPKGPGDSWNDLLPKPYNNKQSVGRRDTLPIGLAALLFAVMAAFWIAHDIFGDELPSDETREFWRHLALTLGPLLFPMGIWYARRNRPN